MTAPGATLLLVDGTPTANGDLTISARHQLEDDALRLVIRRIAREQGWRPCCRSWLTLRLVEDLTGPVHRHPTTGQPVCPHCWRRAQDLRRAA